jgi:hypothetical protein
MVFRQIATDKCVYVKQIKNNYVILCLYVNDIIIFGSNIQVINITKSFLFENLDIKDLGLINVILGNKLLKNSNGFALTQSLYIENYLKGLIILIYLMYVVLSIRLLN